MTSELSLSDEELAIVRQILSSHLPQGYRAFAFGSRAGGRVKPWSDLDIEIEGPEPLPLAVEARLADEFDESLLPWKVDIVDRATVSQTFGDIIDQRKVRLL